jgi:long-chain fatty acid transport protein
MSAEWMRMNNRNAALDAADIVNYNPAGLPMLTEGFHVNLGNQFLFRHPSHSYDFGLGDGEKKFEQDGADFLLPNLYAAYTTEKWAAYTGIYITGGGATVNYPEGSISTDLITTTILYTQPAPSPFIPPTTNRWKLPPIIFAFLLEVLIR